ncbi:MAG: hypothetical protein LJE83_04970 [Gammaproteobacteria bacterium]|nr:hypothetical protein [Gammaproteobacteria bacterium]
MNLINNKLLFVVLITLNSFYSFPASSVTPASAQSNLTAGSWDDFDKGKEYFNQGDYANAVSLFKKVEEQGITSAALYYNLASSYYKLGDYEKSGDYFNKLRSYKEIQDLAEYNLGLIAFIQGDEAAAEKWFNSVVQNSKDKKLVFFAEKKLKDITSQKKPEWVTERWSAYASAFLGYDDNVNFAPLGISTEIADSFSEIYVSADYLFSGDRYDGWLGEVSFYDINYQTEDIFDEREYAAAIKKYLQLNSNWQTIFTLDASKIEYNGEDYQTITLLSAESQNRLSGKQRLSLRYSYEAINSDNPLFDYLQGWRQKLRAEYSRYLRLDNARLYYELELNDRNDLSLSTGDYSYSPTRQLFRGKYTSVFSNEWGLTGDLSYQVSDYPVTSSEDRQDDRIRAAVYADYRFSKDFRLRAKVVYTDNRSTEAIYAYRQTVYSLGVNAYF